MFATLTKYAESRGDLPPPCYRVRPVQWVLDIRIDGGLTMTVDRLDDRHTDAIPTMRRSGSAPMPFLAVDRAAYVLGATGDTVTAKQATARNAAWWQQMAEWMTGPNTHPAVGTAIVAAKTTTARSAHLVPPRDTVAVRVQGIWLHRLPEAQTEWLQIVSRLKGGGTGLCTSCGQVRQLAATLPNAIPAHLIPGLEHDAQMAVLPLHERAKKGTLPICVACGDLAASALQTLLEDPTRASGPAGQNSRTVVFSLDETGDNKAAYLLQLLGASRPRKTPPGGGDA